MRLSYFGACAMALALTSAAFAQEATPGPSLKTIGTPTQARSQVEPSLIVMNAAGATLANNTLTLTGVVPNSIIFADRPVRAAGHALTAHLLEEWDAADSFGKNPPNATVSVFNKDGSEVKDAVVVLKSPKAEGTQISFDVQVLEGNLDGADGPAAVFVDIIGLPFTPLSFAGMARRTARRGAFYAGAAAAAEDPYYRPYAPYAPYYDAPYYRPYYRPY
ncbi:hypothetical protein GCM10007874_12720 [Labrys miyagiensis]|uniref:Uncharacterized protein n=1 Tax=Labrys miyagiensis TaxID=346912 RepID=A0ABQ6CDB4_9HYPH|nr:hypothetical protein [Labrys miyagiensis]GLS18256.1 hypothetical protein GCM10007874_12720 [Labrys miyagiensis]